MSFAFNLDTRGRRAVIDRARETPLDPADIPLPAWQGIGDQAASILRGSASMGRTVLMAGAVPAIAQDRVVSALAGVDSTVQQDQVFDLVENVGSSAVDYWTPDARASGSAAKTVGTVMQVAGYVPAMVGAPGLFLGDAAISPGVEVIKQGGSTSAALSVSTVNLLVNAAGLGLPAAAGKTLGTRVASGATINVALGASANLASQQILKADGLDKLAATYDPTNPQALILDTLMGAAFGGAAHLHARLPPSQGDAVLTARNAEAFANRELPGTPRTGDAAVMHQDALALSMEQLSRGEAVDVGRTVDLLEFELRPELQPRPEPTATTAAPEVDYIAYRRTLESNNRPDAKATTSSATGIDQFTAKTWRDIVRQEQPAWAEGLSDAELLAQRTNPERSGEMALALDRQNAVVLEAEGLPVSRHNLYAMHHFGMDKGSVFAKAADDVRMERILTKQQIEANPYLRGKTKGEAIANWDERARRGGLDVRDAAPLPRALDAEPVQVADGLPPRTPVEVGAIIDQRIATLEELAGQDRLTPDQLADLRAEDAELVAVIRDRERQQRDGVTPADPRAVLSDAEFEFASQRRIEIRQEIERSQASAGYERQLADLRNRLDRIDGDTELARLAETLQPRPARQAVGGTARAEASDAAAPVRPDQPQQPFEPGAPVARDATARSPGVAPNTALPDATSPASPLRARGSATQEPAATVAGIGEGAAPARAQAAGEGAMGLHSSVDALRVLAAERPEATVIDGLNADGSPRYRDLADALAEIDADRAAAQTNAQAFAAAMNCALRRSA